jgi:hypothetical protein
MSRSFIGRLIVTTIGGVIGALTFVVFPALAAGTSGGRTVIIPALAPTATPGGGTATTTSVVPPDIFIYFLLIVFIFGLLLIAGLLYYIYKIQLKYYASSQILSQMGVGVKATIIGSFVVQPPPGVPLAPGEAPKKLTIDGPGFVTVGVHADFIAKLDSAASPADTQWAVTPEGAASWEPKTGPKVAVTPLKIGSFKLTASIGNEQNTDVSVAVVAPQAPTEELPFIGQGYGSLVIAILVVVAVIVLGLTGILGGEAVATLFGGLLGYIFGVTTSTAAKSSKTSDGKTPSATS